jgi:hypothetical protein
LKSATAGPLAGGVRGVPHLVGLHPSFACGNSDAPSRLIIGGRFYMENPTTWRDCRLSLPALDRSELMVGSGANRIRAIHFHSIRSCASSDARHSASLISVGEPF